MKKRVVITGIGTINSIGSTIEEFWESISHGKCGIDLITKFDTSEMSTKVASYVKDFEPEKYIDKKDARRMDRFTQFAMAAAKMAIGDSGINIDELNKDRAGVLIGSGIGGIETIEEQHKVLMSRGAGKVSPFFIPMLIPNMASGRIAIEYGFKGFNETVVTACATGTNAIGDALRVIQRGEADIMVAGGAEAPITPLAMAGFCSMRAMSTICEPQKACRPFDRERDGFVMGEGAGVLILEELQHAINRNAHIYTEIVGYGVTNDAFDIVAPDLNGKGAEKAMQLALNDAEIACEDVDYINAHGTSTILNDKLETQAIKAVFGEYAYKLAISSTKSMTGHLLGAAGAVEAIVCVLSINHKFLPPTINYNNADPDCDLDYVPNKGRTADINYVLSNSLGFGGHNATLLFKCY